MYINVVSYIYSLIDEGPGDDGSASILAIVSGVVGAIIIVAVSIIVTIVVIQANKRYRRENRMLNNQMFHLLRPGE